MPAWSVIRDRRTAGWRARAEVDGKMEGKKRDARARAREGKETRREREERRRAKRRLCREAGRGRDRGRVRAFIHLRHDILKIRARATDALAAAGGGRVHGVLGERTLPGYGLPIFSANTELYVSPKT